MSKIQKDNSGFTLIEVLLVIVTLALIGMAGYFVAKHVDDKVTNKPATTTPKTTTSTKSAATSAASPYTGWKTFDWTYEGLTIKYPPAWVFTDLSNSTDPNYMKNLSNEPFVVIKSSKTQSVQGEIDSVGGGAIGPYTGEFDVELSVGTDGECNVSDNSKLGDPALADYIAKIIPFNVPGYKNMNIIEDGGHSTSTVADMYLTDQPVELGITKSPYLQDTYSSKTHPGQQACISSGFFGHADPSYATYVTIPKDVFENLPDYTNGLNIIKSVNYAN